MRPVPVNAAFIYSKKASRLLILISNFGQTESYYNVDASYLRAVGGRRKVRDNDLAAGDVLQPSRAFEEEVMMLTRVGIKVRTAGIDYDFAKQPSFYKLMKRVVDGRQRNFDQCRYCFFV